MTITDLYQNLFGKGAITDGSVIDMAEHGRVGGVSTGQGFKTVSPIDSSGNTINAASEESLVLIRKIVQILAPLAVQDANQRQRVTIDAIANSAATGSSVSGVDVLVTGGQPPTVGTGTYQAVWTGPVDSRYVLADQSRNTYANGIRPNLSFS